MSEKQFNIILLIVSAISILLAVLNVLPNFKYFFIAFGFSLAATSVLKIRAYKKKSAVDN